MREISLKTRSLIEKLDIKTNEISGYNSNDMSNNVELLMNNGSVEVGYRASCGVTHTTQKAFREWTKIVKSLNNDGFNIKEENCNHKNSYATNNGGFWNSIIYSIQK